MKRAGLTLAQIGALTRDRKLDLGALVDAQIAALDAKAKELGAAFASARGSAPLTFRPFPRNGPLVRREDDSSFFPGKS